MNAPWTEESWAHAGRVAAAYNADRSLEPTAEKATTAIGCHVCGVAAGSVCRERPVQHKTKQEEA